MSGRVGMVASMAGLLVMGVAVPSVFAGSMTTVGAFLQQFALDAQTILYGACAILFSGALIMAGAASYGGVTHLLGVPIYYAMLGSFGAGVISVFLNGVGLTQGAEVLDTSTVDAVSSMLVILTAVALAGLSFVVTRWSRGGSTDERSSDAE